MERSLAAIVADLPVDDAQVVCAALARREAKRINSALYGVELRAWAAELIAGGHSGRDAADVIARELRRYGTSAWAYERDWRAADVPPNHRRLHRVLRLNGDTAPGRAGIRKRLAGVVRTGDAPPR